MKSRLLKSAVLLLGALVLRPMIARAASYYDAEIANYPTIAYSTNVAVDVSQLDDLAMQAVYSSASISAFSFDDGKKATSTLTVVSTQSLTGARIVINGCVLDAGTDGNFTPVSTASGTAKAISDAMMASPCFSAILSSSWTAAGLVKATASVVGIAPNSWTTYVNVSSLTITAFSNGNEPEVSTANDTITLASGGHGISTGYPMYLTTLTGTAPTGLTTGTTYYAIVTGNNVFKLASTSTGSLAGTAIDITAVTGSGTFTLTPTAFAGSWGLSWQSSNDNLNWYTLPNASSVTFATPWTAANTMWDSDIIFKYLRLVVTAGTGGGLNLKVRGYGKKSE